MTDKNGNILKKGDLVIYCTARMSRSYLKFGIIVANKELLGYKQRRTSRPNFENVIKIPASVLTEQQEKWFLENGEVER